VTIGLRRWGVFNLVGLGGFAIQLAAIALLTRGLHWPPSIASIVAIELAFLHNFVGHSRWTWSDYPLQGWRAWAGRWWRYQLAKSVSLGANVLVTTLLAVECGLPVEAANTAAVLLCALPNFVLAERFVFTRPGTSPTIASQTR